MLDTAELGRKGEELACNDLLKKGYVIVQRNYRFNGAEVDIIADHDDKLVFIEVKTRVSSYLSDPSLLVSVKKQKQIIKASDEFVKNFFPEKEWRFDIVVVVTNSEYTSIEHIVDAFYPMV